MGEKSRGGWTDDRDLVGFIQVKSGLYELENLGKVDIVDFELGQYPVTNGWYERFIKEWGYETRGS